MKRKGFLKRIIASGFAVAMMMQSLVVNTYAASKLAAPSGISVSAVTDSSVTLKWNGVKGADAYRVYLWNQSSGEWESAAYITGTSVTLNELTANTKCTFKVESYDLINGKYVKQSSSKSYAFTTKTEGLAGPKNVRAFSIGTDRFQIFWDKVDGASRYLVFYKESGSSKWITVNESNVTTSSLADFKGTVTGLKKGKTYDICVKSYVIENRKYVEQGASEIYTIKTCTASNKMPAHPNIKVQTRSNRIDISWSDYNRVQATKPYSLIEKWNAGTGKWEFIKDKNGNNVVYEGNSVTFTDKNDGIKPGKTYYYRIYTLNNHTRYEVQDCSDIITVKTPKADKSIWDGSVDTSWYTGNKKSYNISTAAQLAGLAKLVNSENSFDGIIINLKKDIKLNDTSDWKTWVDHAPANTWSPIGGAPAASYTAFAGIFNGNGHTISGMYCSTTDVAGLFGLVINGAVINVKLKDSAVKRPDKSGNAIGGIVAKAQGSYIDACEVDGFIIEGENWPIMNIVAMGGIVGEVGLIDKSPIMGRLIFNFLPMIGNLIWNPIITNAGPGVDTSATYVSNCIANDVHITTNKALAAPVVGAANRMIISNCLSTNCTVSSVENNTGAIVACHEKGDINNCYYYNFKATGANKKLFDKNLVKSISKKTLISADFAKKLGAAFEYSKGNAPELREIPEGGIKKK